MATAVVQAVPCVWIVRYNRMFQIERDGVMRHYGQ